MALSKDTPRLVTQEKQTGPAEIVRYEDIFKDPYVLDFLGLKGAYSEKDLEAAIVRNLEQFLTELGTDFCFIARQYAMRVDDDDYSLDLLFYHRGLRCLVAIDLKIGTFTAADKGQMDLYLAWLKEHDWRTGENEPVGLGPVHVRKAPARGAAPAPRAAQDESGRVPDASARQASPGGETENVQQTAERQKS